MHRFLWRPVGSRKQRATQRLLSTSRDIGKRSPEQPSLKIWKHLTTKGDMPYTPHPGLSSGNKSSNPSLVSGPALSSKIRKIAIELGNLPGPQEPERFFGNETFLNPTLVGPPAKSAKVRMISVDDKDDGPRSQAQDPRRFSAHEPLDPSSVGIAAQPFKVRMFFVDDKDDGPRPQAQDPERFSENESLDPSPVGGAAQPSKVRMISVDDKDDGPRPQAQDPERFSRKDFLDPILVDVLASKTGEHAIEKGDTAGSHDPRRSSAPRFFLDPNPTGERKVTNASDIRLLMRRVPHSVAVITSNTYPYEPPESFCGMTVSSFNTVCLEPKIVVSFNIKQPSATYDAIQASGQFNVHLINSTVQGAAIAELFATGRGKEAFHSDGQRNNDGAVSSSTLSTAELEEGEPDLLRSNDVMFTLECKLLDQAVKVADHVIVLGEVLTHRLPPIVQSWDGKSLGMCYVNRLYRRPGRVQLTPSERAGLGGAKSTTGATTSPTSLSSKPDDDTSEGDDPIPVFY